MVKFVTFDDGLGNFNFRAIFPPRTPKKQVYESIRNKLYKYLSARGLTKDDLRFDFEDIPNFTSIVSMRECKFYEPTNGQWDD